MPPVHEEVHVHEICLPVPLCLWQSFIHKNVLQELKEEFHNAEAQDLRTIT